MRIRSLTRYLTCALVMSRALSPFALAQRDFITDPGTTFTHVGQQMPAFSITTLDGLTIKLPDLKGKVALVNFWATWCQPCLYEMPMLEKDIWEKYKSPDFVMVAIAREQSRDEIAAFRKKYGFTFPMAADPARDVYNLVASEGIPRTYVVSSEGTILFQSTGFSPEQFQRMKGIIRKELARVQKVNGLR